MIFDSDDDDPPVFKICLSLAIFGLSMVLVANTSIIEVGRQPFGSVLYKNVMNDHYYVRGGDLSGSAIIEDSVVNKAIDNIQNQYYVVREYSGLLYWKKDRIINVIQ